VGIEREGPRHREHLALAPAHLGPLAMPVAPQRREHLVGALDALRRRPAGRVQVEISMFSATVRSVKIPPSSGANPTPRRAISWVRRPWISSPWKTMRPARGRR